MKRIIISILILFVLMILVLLTACSKPMGGDLVADLSIKELPKLKTTKDKILKYKITKEASEKPPLEIEDVGPDIVSYDYISTSEVPQAHITVNGKVINEDLSKRTESSQHFKIKEMATSTQYIGKLFAGQTFYKDNDKWYQIETATATIEVYELETATSSEFLGASGDPIYSYNNGDGRITSGSNGNSTWSTVYGATTGSFRTDKCYPNARYISGNYYIDRNWFNFDTSVIGAGQTVSSVVMSIYGYRGNDAGTVTTYNIYGSTAHDDIEASDFNNFLSVAYSDTSINNDAWGSASYKTYTFNATGIAAAQAAIEGILKLSFREANFDAPNTSPSANNEYPICSLMETAGTDQDPYLTIVYSSGGGAVAEPEYASDETIIGL